MVDFIGGLRSNKVNVIQFELITVDDGEYTLFAKNCTPKEYFEYLGGIMNDGIVVNGGVGNPAPGVYVGATHILTALRFIENTNMGKIEFDLGNTVIDNITAVTYNGETYVGNFVPA